MPYTKQELKKRNAEYYIAHRAELLKKQAALNVKNHIAIAEYQSEYRINNRAQHKDYYATHRAEAAWYNMQARCKDSSNKDWKRYGGATPPVRICQRWSGPKGKDTFVKDMGQPKRGQSISRFGDIGNYSPSNCAWHTWAQQLAEAAKKRLMKGTQ